MSIGIICCRVLEEEIREIVGDDPRIGSLSVMEWGLHTKPDQLLESLCRRIREIQGDVKAIVLGYGKCMTLDKLPGDFEVPVFYPEGEDCIGVLLGQERYREELMKEAGTWFLTPGWTRMGMDFIFSELQVRRFAEKGLDPMQVARRMLRDYTRALSIHTVGDRKELRVKAEKIAADLGLRLEETEGSLSGIRKAIEKAFDILCRAQVTAKDLL